MDEKEDECVQMLDHLQQYVPHLEKLIAQLKDPTQKNCGLQVNQVEAVCNLIMDRTKKVKLDTLLKLEAVILKILHRLHPTIFKQLMSKPEPMIEFVCKDLPEGCNTISLGKSDEFINLQKLTAARACLSETAITPASSSPPRDIPSVHAPHAPITIPTEKIHKLALNPNEFHSKKWDVKTQPNLSQPYNESYKTEKPNVYNRIAESLTSSRSKKIDLQQLTAPEGENYFVTAAERDSYCTDHEQLAIGEFKDLREVLLNKLQQRRNFADLRTKLTRKNSNKLRDKEQKADFTIKPDLPPRSDKEQKVQLPIKPLPVPPLVSSVTPKSPRVEKIYKNPDQKEKDKKSDKKTDKDDKKDQENCNENKCRNNKEVGKDKSSSLDKSKDHKSNQNDKKVHGKVNTHKKEPVQLEKVTKSPIKCDPRCVLRSLTVDDTSKSVENEEILAFKSLEDKYNSRPQKTSTEVQDKKVLNKQKIDDLSQKIPFLNDIIPNKDINIIDKIPADILVNNVKQNMSGSWIERKSPNFESRDKTNPMSRLLASSHKEPLINILPTGVSFMQPSSGSSNMQGHNTTNNQMIYGNNQMGNVNNQMVQQKEVMTNQNNYFSPQQNLMHQNIPANQCGNTYMNTFRLQNVSNNISHTQFKISLNATPNTFDNKMNPAKVFHPFDAIERNSEYYLSKIPITKEKHTKEETTTAEVEVKTKTRAKEKIKVVEKEDIAKETETREIGENEDEEEKEGEEQNEKLVKSKKISLRKHGQTKMKKEKILQSKQPLKTLKVNIEKKKKVQSVVKLEDNVIETVAERIKNRRRNIKTPEPTKPPKCRSELDMLHEDIKEIFICDGATGINPILKSDSEEAAETDIVSTRSFRNKLTSTADEEAASVLNSLKRRATLSNLKVVIKKIDLSKLVASNSKKDSDSGNEFLETTRLRAKTRPTSDSNSLSPIKRFMPKRNFKPKPSYTEDADEELPESMSEPEEEPLKQEEPQTNSNEKQTVAKKGQNLASSVVKKSYKKLHSYTTSPKASVDGDRSSVSDLAEVADEPMPQEDNEGDIEFIEPDKNYYFDPQDKNECKLCSFKENMIVQHYKTVHAKHEVLISRISPDNANTAIEESIANGYEDIEVTDTWEAKNRMKTFSYQCRFCQMFFKNENSESFFDHLTGHTGEYRFICKLCPFKTTNCKSLRIHMDYSHNVSVELSGSIMPTYQAPPNFHIAFGYICAECNFIQMDKTRVQTHVEIYHLGENMKIYKINMSTIVSKPTEVPEENALAELGEEVSKKPNESEVEQMYEIEEVEQPVTQVQELQPEPAQKAVKEDLAVFKPNTEYGQENIEFDKKKHEKMKEIDTYVKHKKKFTFNLLDKIKSRLDDWHVEAVAKEIENNGSSMQLNSSADSITSCSKKSVVQGSMENNVGKSTVNKTSVPIFNIIDRLTFVPDREEAIVRVGPVGATNKNDYILYICYIQFCMFSSRSQFEFATHCKTFHKHKLWDGFCSICNINTSFTKVEEAYDHLLSMHENDFETDTQTITIESSENQWKVKYLYMKSGDKLSENVELQQEQVLEYSHGFPFHIVNVTTLTPEEEQTLNTPEITPPTTAVEKVLPTSTVINTVAGAGGIPTVSRPTTSPIAIPFPLQSTNGSLNGLPLMPPVRKCAIKPYSRNMWESSSSNGEVQAKQPALETSENPVKAEADLDDTSILICNYCSKRCYKCCYCDIFGSMETLKEHFRSKHPRLSFSVFRYQCPHCGDYFKIINKFKDHCRIVHNDCDPVSFYIYSCK